LREQLLERYIEWRITLIFLFLILMLSIILAAVIGPVYIPFELVFKIICAKLPISSDLIAQSWSQVQETIIIQIRLPRILLGALVGAALASAGAAMQGLFKNPMADPYIIGISSGGALGAAIAIVFHLTLPTLPFISFLGSISAAFIVYNISKVDEKIPVATLLLSGIAIGAFLSAITSFLMYIAGESLHQIVFWLMGGLSSSDWDRIKIITAPLISGMVLLSIYARELNIMLLGDEEAQSLGVEVEKLKKLTIAISALLTGVAVSVSGIIGFVGLIIPHIIRLMLGPDHRILIPAAALMGGIFIVLADIIARTIIAPTELPIGIITAFFGAPFFIYLLQKRRKMVLTW
jgi:iron complex transport system permease protein